VEEAGPHPRSSCTGVLRRFFTWYSRGSRVRPAGARVTCGPKGDVSTEPVRTETGESLGLVVFCCFFFFFVVVYFFFFFLLCGFFFFFFFVWVGGVVGGLGGGWFFFYRGGGAGGGGGGGCLGVGGGGGGGEEVRSGHYEEPEEGAARRRPEIPKSGDQRMVRGWERRATRRAVCRSSAPGQASFGGGGAVRLPVTRGTAPPTACGGGTTRWEPPLEGPGLGVPDRARHAPDT